MPFLKQADPKLQAIADRIEASAIAAGYDVAGAIDPDASGPESEVTLVFSAPVYVVVRRDGDDNVSIAKVVVDDENTDFTIATCATTADGNRDLPLTDPDVLEALACVNDGARSWPSWEFGW